MKQFSDLIGAAGMLVTVVGLFLSPDLQRWWFLGGAAAMLYTAACNRQLLFIILQGIVLAAIITSFLDIPPLYKAGLPLIISIPLLAGMLHAHLLQRRNLKFGAVALMVLSVGYAVQNYAFFIAAGLMLSLFAGMEVRYGFRQAWLWLLLNMAFTISAIVNSF